MNFFFPVFCIFFLTSLYAEQNLDKNPLCKEPINCYCYTPPFYNLDCDRGFFIYAEFLYWFAKDTALTYSQKTKGQEIPELEPLLTSPVFFEFPEKFEEMSKSWDPGVRLGLGWKAFCKDCDLQLSWTYFHSDKKENESVPPFAIGVPNDFLLNPWSNPILAGDLHFSVFNDALYSFVPFYTNIEASWKENINIIDLDFGRKYWLSKCLSLRPFFGVRGSWDKAAFQVNSRLDRTDLLIATNRVSYKSRFWGVGLLGGFQPSIHFLRCFSLFGNLDLALLYGKYKTDRKEQNSGRILGLDDLSISIPTASRDYKAMQAILDLALGIRWESNLCCKRYHLAFDLSWEHHLWFNHNRLFQLRGGVGGLARDTGFTEFKFVSAAFDENYGDLTLGGLVVSARFDF